MVFAFKDAAATTKALTEATIKMEAIKLKGGFLDKQALSPAQVKALAELPPLPVVRAQLLGVLQAPAGRLVRTLADRRARWPLYSAPMPIRLRLLRNGLYNIRLFSNKFSL